MVEPVRHRQTKGAATDMFGLQSLRHISTLPDTAVDLAAPATPWNKRGARRWEVYSGRSLTRPSPAPPRVPPGLSAPCCVSADWGFSPFHKDLYRGLKLSRISAAFGSLVRAATARFATGGGTPKAEWPLDDQAPAVFWNSVCGTVFSAGITTAQRTIIAGSLHSSRLLPSVRDDASGYSTRVRIAWLSMHGQSLSAGWSSQVLQ
jgi:hypothetical protein